MSKVLAVDLDGVIFSWDQKMRTGGEFLKEFGSVVPGAVEALNWFREQGWKIVVFTCRTNPELFTEYRIERLIELVKEGLERSGIPYDRISCYKPVADLYIDDMAMRFVSWGEVLSKVWGQS